MNRHSHPDSACPACWLAVRVQAVGVGAVLAVTVTLMMWRWL